MITLNYDSVWGVLESTRENYFSLFFNESAIMKMGRLMLKANLEPASAAFRVGYDNPSFYSRATKSSSSRRPSITMDLNDFKVLRKISMSDTGYKAYFGNDLAILLSQKICSVYPQFKHKSFCGQIKKTITQLELKARVQLIAESLRTYLPNDYPDALSILLKILGPENQNETGMFKTGYWLMPVAKFVELYGLKDYKASMKAIYEITKRHTGEYTIRPFINHYPQKTMSVVNQWAQDKNVHVRRLASEGIRPRLPWAQKLTLFIEDPAPVFAILEHLKDDASKFVQKSVANNINDYLKDNPEEATRLLNRWRKNPTPQRQWIISHAMRNQPSNQFPQPG